ncbi:MAG: hypothetical protein ACRC8Y_11740 [Chroococcales cyanobacterium]
MRKITTASRYYEHEEDNDSKSLLRTKRDNDSKSLLRTIDNIILGGYHLG